MGEASGLKRLARRLWLPLFGAMVLLFALFWIAHSCHHKMERLLGHHLAGISLGLPVGLAIVCGMLGLTFLLIRFLMPDEGPSNRAQTIYVVVFCALAGIIYLVQREVGHAKFWRHPAWTHPFTVPGTISMLLSRFFFEGARRLLDLALLPFGLFTQACLWFPLLLGRRGRWG